MQAIQYVFDVTNIDPFVAGGQVLPGGWYMAPIIDMECKENNTKGTGHNLWLESTVIEGEFKGRKFYENLNLWHSSSSAAVEIAEKQLSAIGHAVGVLTGNDLTVLANKPMLVEIELQDAQPDKTDPNTGNTIKGRGPQNRVVQRKPATPENIALYLNGQPANGAVPGAAAPQQAAQAAAAGKAPAFNPASAAPAAAASQAPAFNPAAAAPAANAPSAAPASATPVAAGGAVPPWQKSA